MYSFYIIKTIDFQNKSVNPVRTIGYGLTIMTYNNKNLTCVVIKIVRIEQIQSD